MLTVRLDFRNLALFRLRAGPGPAAEKAFALHLYADDTDLTHHRWRRRIRSRLGDLAGPVADLAGRRSLPDLLTLAAGDPAGDHALLEAFASVAVIPHWPEISGRIAEARDSGSRTVVTKGIGRMLESLHPRLQWQVPVLRFRGGPDRELDLGDRGLALSFAYFLDKSYHLVEEPGEAPILIIPLNPAVRGELGAPDDGHGPELGDLMGHTRAVALQLLTDTLTTGELAERLGITLAGASRHASVLRRAGLVTTRRSGSAGLHRLTSLGVALLEGRRLSGETGPISATAPMAQAG